MRQRERESPIWTRFALWIDGARMLNWGGVLLAQLVPKMDRIENFLLDFYFVFLLSILWLACSDLIAWKYFYLLNICVLWIVCTAAANNILVHKSFVQWTVPLGDWLIKFKPKLRTILMSPSIVLWKLSTILMSPASDLWINAIDLKLSLRTSKAN